MITKAKRFLLLSIGLFNAVSCVTLDSDAPLARPPPDFSHIVAPSSGTPGENFAVYVHVEATPPERLPQSVSVLLMHPTDGLVSQDGPRTILSGSFNAFLLEIPVDVEPAVGRYTLEVQMKTHTNASVNRTLPLTIRGDNRIIMIQTDKPIYKPGQTVLGRVIVLNRDMKSADGSVTVTIQNPASYTMGRLSDIDLDTGVGKFEFPLSAEPVLGTYKLCATYEGLPRGQRSCFDFNVQRYGKDSTEFSCSVTPTDEVVGCGLRKICFSVTATYTYGQKVKGNLTARVQSSYSWYRCVRGEQTLVTKIDGTADVCVDVCSRNRICSGDMVIDANVTDPTSGTTVQCEGQTSVPVRSRPYKLTIVEEDRDFSPCHYSKVKVFASTVTGKPRYANVSLSGSLYLRNKKKCRRNVATRLGPFYQLTDRSGMATFDICMSCNSLDVSFTATVVGDDRSLFSSAYSYRYMIYAPGRIALSSSSQQVQVGGTAGITASFSRANNADYYVVSKGRIVDHGRCTPGSDRKARRKHPQLCKTGGIRKTCYISFTVTSSMAPKFTVIVSQKNLAASRIAFDVTQNERNQISLEFQDDQVRPGDETSVTIGAPPSSYIGVVAVDQSVYIQQEKNQLTTGKLYKEAARFDGHKPLPRESYQCGWYVYWDCRCRCIGRYPSPGNLKGEPTRPPMRPLPTADNGSDIRPVRPKGDKGGDMRRRDTRSKRLSIIDPPIRPPTKGDPGNCCPRYCTKPAFRPQYCSYFKATSYFIASGIQVSDNDITPPKTCQKPDPPPKPGVMYDCCYHYLPILRRLDGPDGNLGPVAATTAPDDRDGGSDDLALPSRVRKHFPETWLWFERVLRDNQSSLLEEVTVPDTITSWVADAFAVSPSMSMTIARPAALRVFKPFFVSINLPYSVIRGELVEISLTVFNYLDIKLTGFVDLLVNDNELRVVQSKDDKTDLKQRSKSVDVAAGESESISYYLLPLKNGHLPIQATARSRSAADSLIRNLLVEPEGVKEEYSQSSLICVGGDTTPTASLDSFYLPCLTRQFNVSLPPDFVPDSESAVASLTANFMGPTVNGLESLLRIPTGCGEQNMLNFAPAVYIARYLDTVGQLDAATRKKALHFMQTGYQREMTYQRSDGSYSAFGDSDRCGSMCVCRKIIWSSRWSHRHERVQQEAIDFILSRQNEDGSFPPVCQPHHKEMQGCSGGNCTLTAYVTLALLEAGVLPTHDSVRSALNYLASNCITANCNSPYTLALVAYTLTKADVGSTAAEQALKLLQQCAITEGDHTYWQYTKAPVCHDYSWSYYCRTRSCDVETTAYALLAFVKKADIPYSLGIVRWLIEQRNPRGGFKSTQDTVVALQALSEYAELTVSDGRVSASSNMSADELSHTFTIDSSNAMQVQSVELPRLPTVLDISICGTGCILASVGVKYNVPRPDTTASFEVSATANKQQGACKYQVRVCNRWIRDQPESSNMAVTEITFFSGFLPVQSELKQLQKAGTCLTKRTEFEGRVLRVYFDEVTQKRCCFDITMKRASVVKDLQGVPVITYNYYEPDERGGSMLYPREEC